MKIKFCGAARRVTGSCHMICFDGGSVLVDCGMRQGADEKGPLGAGDFAFDPSSISAVLLTHAHIDHSGLLPLLVKRGFNGKIVTTKATAELSGIMLPDSAHIQEQDAEYQNRKNLRAGKPMVEPMYTAADVQKTLELFQPVSYGDIVEIIPGLRARFVDVGHLLGSAAIEIWIEEKSTTTKLVFSGDIGREERPILRDPASIDEADYLVIEGTYGDREHDVVREEDKEKQLADVLKEGIAKGGNIVIPSFAVGRTQELLYTIKRLLMKNAVPGLEKVPVFVDSPLGINATKVYERCAREYYDEEALDMLKSGGSPFDLPTLRVAETGEESKLINFQPGCNIIISSSGMCDAGRIRHHLKHNLYRPDSTILFVGYQANGTLGRILLDGAKSVKLFGEQIQVNASIRRIEGFSGHAGRSELLQWIRGIGKPPKCVFLVHGESSVLDKFAADVRALGLDAEIPDLLDEYGLSYGSSGVVRMPALSPKKDSEPDLFIGTRLNMIARLWGINGAFYAMRATEPLYDTAIGVADEIRQNLNGIHTKFSAGAITMPFTAAAALILDQHGVLRLDDKLGKYVPEYAHGDEITIREILLNQKAVPDYVDYSMAFKLYTQAHEQGLNEKAKLQLEWNALNSPISDEEILSIVNELPVVTNTETSCGKRSSFRLLGMALERACAKSLKEIFEQLIFSGLSLKDTSFGGEAGVTYSTNAAEERIQLPSPENMGGEAGILTSAYDLVRFGIALENGVLLDEEHTDIFFAPEACGLMNVNGWFYADSGYSCGQSCLYMNLQYNVAAAMLMNAPCTLEDTDDVGAYSFAQRMRYEMDDVYIRKDVIELAPIDVSNVYAILKLSVDSKQQGFVAENALSLAEAVALEGKALPYAIVQNGVAVGFAMIYVDGEHGEYCIWRLMIDKRFQHKGFGTAAMKLVIAELKRLGADKITLSVEPDNEDAASLYRKLGFAFNGRLEDGEAYMELKL